MVHLISDFRKVPVLRALGPLVSGIIIYVRFPDLRFLYLVLYVALTFLILAALASIIRREICIFCLKGILFTCIFFLLGYALAAQKPTPLKLSSDKEIIVIGSTLQAVLEKEKTYMLTLRTSYIENVDTIISSSQKLVVYVMKSEQPISVTPGDIWCFKGQAVRIENKGNPGEFDYAGYMNRKGFYHLLFVDASDAHFVDSDQSNKMRFLPMQLRAKISSRWPSDWQASAVLSAICLGDKTMLERNTKQHFSDAGAMHLLAVSGLHVGIVWWILDLLIRFPGRKRLGKFLKLLLIVSILWFYAGITGFSESVTRSVLMFSLFTIASTLNRESNIFNTLFLSAFILLVLKPERIVEPGFQLSYLAVFGIVTIQPGLRKLLHSENKIIKWIFDLITVSIAAQLITFPLVLLYFHQFPIWFLLTNIIAIPLVTVLLALFVIFAPAFIVGLPFCFLDSILLKISGFLDQSLAWIARLPGAVLADLPMRREIAFLLLLVLLFSLAMAYYRKVTWLIAGLALLSTVFIVSGAGWMKYSGEKGNEIYTFSDATIISMRNGFSRKVVFFAEHDSLSPYLRDYIQDRFLVPKRTKSQVIYDLKKADGERYLISEGLWAFREGDEKILLVGACSPEVLRHVLENRFWDLIVLRHAYPRAAKFIMMEMETDGLKGCSIVQDGTVAEWERF